jgi:hypothetical protein
MVLAFFDSKDHIYINYVPREKMVNAQYIIEALILFLRVLKQKGLAMATRPETVGFTGIMLPCTPPPC